MNRKIAIDVKGEIKNCPSIPKSYGNVKNTSLLQVASEKDFQQLWQVKKDNIAVCKDCEFRHVCTDCRAFTEDGELYGKPSKCNYDPYTATWVI